MKRSILLVALLTVSQLIAFESAAQSRSFQTFREKFSGEDDVHYFKVSGFIVRSLLGLAGEQEAKEAVRGIHRVRLAVVPRQAFDVQNVTVNGFRNILRQDNFAEMMNFREDGDEVTVYSNSPGRRDHQYYMMLVEADNEIVLIEISGRVNEAYFKDLIKLQSQRT